VWILCVIRVSCRSCFSSVLLLSTLIGGFVRYETVIFTFKRALKPEVLSFSFSRFFQKNKTKQNKNKGACILANFVCGGLE